MEEFSTSS
jgi:hypothetical protein